jgi:hypothetical protein
VIEGIDDRLEVKKEANPINTIGVMSPLRISGSRVLTSSGRYYPHLKIRKWRNGLLKRITVTKTSRNMKRSNLRKGQSRLSL